MYMQDIRDTDHSNKRIRAKTWFRTESWSATLLKTHTTHTYKFHTRLGNHSVPIQLCLGLLWAAWQSRDCRGRVQEILLVPTMSDSLPEPKQETKEKMELYIWPHFWNLPSFDMESLAAVLYLQLAFRHHNHKHEHHHYTLVECTDPDLSPSGTLPFLVHGSKKVTTFNGIVRHLESLDMGLSDEGANKEGEANALRRSKRVAWTSLVDSQLRDLVVSFTLNVEIPS